MPRKPKDPCADRAMVTPPPVDPEEQEILAAIVQASSGILRTQAMPVAAELLMRFGALRFVLQASPEDLQQVKGITPLAAGRIHASGRACERRTPFKSGAFFSSSQAVGNYLSPKIAHLGYEVFILLCMNARNRLIREAWISQGTLTSCPVHPREVFRAAISAGSASVLLAHNHPSGNPEPSADDISLTRRLERAGKEIGIKVLDHIIVGSQGIVSLAERGVVG